MTTVRGTAAQAGNTAVVEKGARLGFAASGMLHLLIAWVIVQLALGAASGEQADQEGALKMLAGNPVGSVLLWLTVVGFAFLALWQLTDAIVRRGAGDKLKALGKAVVYAALGWTAFTVVQGRSGSQESSTAELLASAGGRLLVGAVGLGIVGVAVYHVWKGWTRSFLRDLREHPGTWVERAGRIGYIAKGFALALVGGFLVAAAVGRGSQDAGGLDGALQTVATLPAGTVLLVLTALGFAAFGVYSFGRARYARI